jgi:F-type H+-transporting ATPase subunit gamma
LLDSGFPSDKQYSVPNSVSAITSLVEQILIELATGREERGINEFYIFHNRPKQGAGYEPVSQRLLPFDQKWRQDLERRKWPTKKLPQIVGDMDTTLSALINGYLFVSLYKACSESLASENASRLEAMQRAEKNIDELLAELNANYHRLRQETIDEELFDVVSGFEAIRK